MIDSITKKETIFLKKIDSWKIYEKDNSQILLTSNYNFIETNTYVLVG